MAYEYEGDHNAQGFVAAPAENVVDNDGACPPVVIEYRIYPVENFQFAFGSPPDSVTI